jgi:type IV pilus assembly protein PilM
VSEVVSAGRLGARGLGWMRRQFVEPDRPAVAIEVRASSVGVLRVRREKRRLLVSAAAVLELPPGTLSLSLTHPNIVDGQRFSQAVHGALERAGILGGARVALVLPDTAARVALVPAVDVPARQATEIDELLRFRLRRSIPFEVREARLAYATGGNDAADTIVVATAFSPVVAQYEEACRSLDLEPGLVEIAGLALARAAFPAPASGDGLLVNWDEGYLSLVLARNGWPILLRTLSGAAVASQGDVVREVSSTLIYYRERLGGSGVTAAFVRSSVVPPDDAVEALADVVGFVPAVLDAWTTLGGAPPEVAQALAGAAASLGAPA